MKRNLLLTNIFLAIFIFAIIFFMRSHKTVRSEDSIKALPPEKIALGAWVEGFWDSKTKTLDVSKMKDFETQLDKKMAIANIFSEWTYLEKPDFLIKMQEVSQNNWTPMISANPLFFEGCPDNGGSIYRAIAEGSCDTFLRNVAKNFKAHEKTILFRFAWEMNHPGMWWSIEKTNSTPSDFVDAWKHMHTLFKEEQAENVEFVLSFNTSSKKSVPYKELFPGDEYVDWVAIDMYNWGTSAEWSKWMEFGPIFHNSYEELVALSQKPMMISEFGTTRDGGDKAAWYDSALNVEIPYKYKAIKAIVFFNENKSQNEGVDWRIESSSDAVITVRAALRNALYSSEYRNPTE